MEEFNEKLKISAIMNYLQMNYCSCAMFRLFVFIADGFLLRVKKNLAEFLVNVFLTFPSFMYAATVLQFIVVIVAFLLLLNK